jgi:putative ABC transport system permease protein
VRKVLGALKSHLTLQFLAESVLVASLAFCMAEILLKLISAQAVVRRLIADIPQDWTLWIYFFVFILFTGLVAGWVPARILSSFQPVRVLSGKFNTRLFGAVGLRKALMVVQFAASLVAIITLFVFYRQSDYMANGDYGFTRDRLLNISLHGQSYEELSAAFSAVSGVEDVSAGSELFGFSGGDSRSIRRQKVSDSLTAAFFYVSPSFLHNLGLTLLTGKDLPSSNSETANRSVVINEEASRQLQFTDPYEAVGQVFWLNDSTQYQVSGVVKDFHFNSFLSSIQPLILLNHPAQFKIVNIKVAKGSEQNIIPRLENEWKKISPHQSFEASWYDKELYKHHLHGDDLVFIGLLTGMALTVACLGLLGMVIYTAKNRSKEVSIRRVMGAKVWQVIVVISKDFVWLLLLAICLGVPLGFFAGDKFLQQYAYRVSIGFGILAGSAASVLCLGGLTIGWQTFRTALTNPANSLRTE